MRAWLDPEGLSDGNPYYWFVLAGTVLGLVVLVWSLTPWFPLV